jgi:hypothetical protein
MLAGTEEAPKLIDQSQPTALQQGKALPVWTGEAGWRVGGVLCLRYQLHNDVWNSPKTIALVPR